MSRDTQRQTRTLEHVLANHSNLSFLMDDNVSSAPPRTDVHSSRPIGRVGVVIARAYTPLARSIDPHRARRESSHENSNARNPRRNTNDDSMRARRMGESMRCVSVSVCRPNARLRKSSSPRAYCQRRDAQCRRPRARAVVSIASRLRSIDRSIRFDSIVFKKKNKKT